MESTLEDFRENIKRLRDEEEKEENMSMEESVSSFVEKVFWDKETRKFTIKNEEEGLFEYDVVGESHYDVGGIVKYEDVYAHEVECLLLFEDDNPVDKKAVMVTVITSIEGGRHKTKQVGYMCREEAQGLRKKLKKFGDVTGALTYGYITGHDGLYGVTVILPFCLED